MLNAHAENSTKATGSICIFFKAHFDLSGLISTARTQSAQSYALYESCLQGEVVAHTRPKSRAQFSFLAVEQQFSYDKALYFPALLIRNDKLQ